MNTITQNKRLIGIFITVGLLLMVPLIAMLFTNEVDWNLPDFILMGVLLSGTGLVCELIIRKVRNLEYRLFIIGAALFVLLLIWAELAVGIFGTPFAGS